MSARCPDCWQIPCRCISKRPDYLALRERALRAESLLREKDEAIGELLDCMDCCVECRFDKR